LSRPPATRSIFADPRWEWLSPILACPVCQQGLRVESEAGASFLVCRGCEARFRPSAGDVMDLRCGAAKTHTLSVTTGAAAYGPLLDHVRKGPPPITYVGPLPERATGEFMSVIKDGVASGGLIVEVGGGGGRYREPVLGLGFRFLTTDYESAGADLLADAHALPFKAASADAVLMQSVSQALENPFVAFREVARVAKPGGLVLGTVDCCAVFASSFYNMTPWGLLSVLQSSGLSLERLWTTKDALEFCGTNPGYPRLVKPILRGLSRFSRMRILTPRNLLKGGPADSFVTAGSIAFISRKPA